MCLIANKKEARFAKSDIVCYKAVEVTRDGFWRSVFGFSDRKFAFGKPVEEDSSRRAVYIPKWGFLKVGGGYFHSCASRGMCSYIVWEALNLFRCRNGRGDYPGAEMYVSVCECVIPKGARYYEDPYGNLASKSIIVGKPDTEPVKATCAS